MAIVDTGKTDSPQTLSFPHDPQTLEVMAIALIDRVLSEVTEQLDLRLRDGGRKVRDIRNFGAARPEVQCKNRTRNCQSCAEFGCVPEG
jgi:hypothetical protein